jgi:calcium-dependent protein kinase
VSQLKKQY